MSFNLKKIFDDYVKNNQKEWKHDRSTTVGASEVFSCLRKVFLEKRGEELGHEPDEDYQESWGALVRGDLIENEFVEPVLKSFKKDGVKLKFAGKKQKTLVHGKNSATPDGLYINCPRDVLKDYGIEDIESNEFAVEIKSMDPRGMDNLEEEKAIHRGQAQVQLGLFRKLTKYNPKYCIIIYVNASFYDDLEPFIVEYDPSIMKAAEQRAPKIWETNEINDIPAEGRMSGGCKYCRWTTACGAAIKESFPSGTNAAPLDGEEDLKITLIDYDDLKQLIKEKELELKEKGEEIKQFLTAANTKKAEGETEDKILKASTSWIKGRKTIDKKKMEEDGIDLSKYEKEGNGYARLNVTVKNKDTEFME